MGPTGPAVLSRRPPRDRSPRHLAQNRAALWPQAAPSQHRWLMRHVACTSSSCRWEGSRLSPCASRSVVGNSSILGKTDGDSRLQMQTSHPIHSSCHLLISRVVATERKQHQTNRK